MKPASDPLKTLDIESRFGFTKEDLVKIISKGAFHGQIQKVIGFTETFVITTVSGPTGEPDSGWWFEPGELEHYQSAPLLN